MTVQDKKRVLEAVKGESVRSSEKILLSLFPSHEVIRPEKIKPVTTSTIRLEMNLPKAVFEKLAQLKNMKATENFEELISQLVELGMNKWDKTREVKSRARNAPPLVTSTVKRNIPAGLKRKIWQRDKGQCQYRSRATGKVCNERFGLHLDHIKPFAMGGDHSEENLRLLCASHNLHRAKQSFPETRRLIGQRLE